MQIEPRNLITFPIYETLPYIKHGFSTRLGGVSREHLGSMNLSFSRGDEEENVIENYKRICQMIGVETKNLVFSDQVHGTTIYTVGTEDTQGENFPKKRLIDVDGLITKESDVVLCTFYADCVPLFFVDTKEKAIGLSHSGWRGTVGKIGAKTVEAMREQFSSKPENIKAVIGPSICQNCYEISEDVAEEVRKVFLKKEGDAILKPKQNSTGLVKYQCDLWKANELILREAGLLEHNIYTSKICTCCNADWLFSHRASNGKRGNLAAFLSLHF